MQVKSNPRQVPPEGTTVERGAAKGSQHLNAAAIPEGFRPLNLPRNPFIEANGPLHGRLEGER